MHNIKSITQKDRYGNMFSLELFEDQGVPLMIMIPDAPDGLNGADTSNHPGNPKGTDTVPAWLTPGENVVNAEASRITKHTCLLYTSPSPRDRTRSRMPSSA